MTESRKHLINSINYKLKVYPHSQNSRFTVSSKTKYIYSFPKRDHPKVSFMPHGM